jgi:hypothetical protein
MLTGTLPTGLTELTAMLVGGLDLRWNALFTDDPVLRAFLAAKQNGGDWEGTQTIPPAGVAAARVSSGTARVSWSPIAYSGDGGGYRVEQGGSPSGPFAPVAGTAGKDAAALDLPAPPPGTTAYFVVTAFTPPHAANSNTVTSAASPPAELPPHRVVHLRRALRSR